MCQFHVLHKYLPPLIFLHLLGHLTNFTSIRYLSISALLILKSKLNFSFFNVFYDFSEEINETQPQLERERERERHSRSIYQHASLPWNCVISRWNVRIWGRLNKLFTFFQSTQGFWRGRASDACNSTVLEGHCETLRNACSRMYVHLIVTAYGRSEIVHRAPHYTESTLTLPLCTLVCIERYKNTLNHLGVSDVHPGKSAPATAKWYTKSRIKWLIYSH